MKRGTCNHPKAKDLARRLNIGRPQAIGTLAMLWSWASEFTPAGDIGRYSDDMIADEVCWGGTASELVRALLDAGWIEPDAEFRLRIHDWPDHCEDTIHARLARAHQRFADGSVPKLTKLGEKERKEAEEFYQRQPSSANGSLPPPYPPPPPLPVPPQGPLPEPKPSHTSAPRKAQALSADDLIAYFQQQPVYATVDVKTEVALCIDWWQRNKGRVPSQRGVGNWLGRAVRDAPLLNGNGARPPTKQQQTDQALRDSAAYELDLERRKREAHRDRS
jgi:hypothetical protein